MGVLLQVIYKSLIIHNGIMFYKPLSSPLSVSQDEQGRASYVCDWLLLTSDFGKRSFWNETLIFLSSPSCKTGRTFHNATTSHLILSTFPQLSTRGHQKCPYPAGVSAHHHLVCLLPSSAICSGIMYELSRVTALMPQILLNTEFTAHVREEGCSIWVFTPLAECFLVAGLHLWGLRKDLTSSSTNLRWSCSDMKMAIIFSQEFPKLVCGFAHASYPVHQLWKLFTSHKEALLRVWKQLYGVFCGCLSLAWRLEWSGKDVGI